MFKRPLTLFTAVLLAVFPTLGTAQDDADADTVVATVNGAEITLGHVLVAKSNLPDQYQGLPADVLYPGLLEQLVQQTLLSQTLDILPKSIELAIENDRRQILANAALESLIADSVTEEDIQAAYDADYGSAEPEEEFNASHILVETEEEAAALLTQAQGDADFALLAQEHSTGPSGPNGGQLGWFGPGQMVPPFEAAVMEMEVGAVAGPVQTQFGWHIIRLNDKRNQVAPTLDMVRPEIEADLQETAARTWIDALTQAADIVEVEGIDPEVIHADISLDD